MMKFRACFSAMAAVAALFASTNDADAGHIPTTLELGLVVDVSGSVNSGEYNLMMDGYGQAFRNPALHGLLGGPGGNSMAVSVTFFASSASTLIGSTLIDTAADAMAFATTLENFARPFSGGTNIPAGINAGASHLFGNHFDGNKLILDVSGDGTSGSTATANARDAALMNGIDTINGLSIGSASIETFFTNFVIGGDDPFVQHSSNFNQFGDAATEKILREFEQAADPVPEPASIAVWSVLLLCVACAMIYMRRHKLQVATN